MEVASVKLNSNRIDVEQNCTIGDYIKLIWKSQKLFGFKSNRFVHQSANAGVAPHVFCRLHHVDDGEYGENDAHDADGSPDSSHEGEGEKIAAHGDTCIAYRRDDGEE